MTHLTKKRLTIAAFGVFCFLGYTIVWTEYHLRSAPIETEIRRPTSSYIGSKHFTYCKGIYGIAEFGDIRLAVRGCWFWGGTYGSEIVLANAANGSWAGGSGGTGQKRFTSRQIDGGTACTFAGQAFEIVNGTLRINGKTVPVDDGDRLIIVNTSGQIESIVEI